MKAKLVIFTIVFALATGCSLLFGSPTATVKAFMAAAKKGDSEAMTKLFSSKARASEDKIRANNKQFADMSQKANASTGPYNMNQITETKTGNTARVSFLYQNEQKTDSIKFVVDLSREGGVWKIDDFGGADKEEAAPSDQPSPTSSHVVPQPPPPTPLRGSGENQPKTISGGVLNGKAISLPKPAYPPVAKAAKASGSVNVQVTVDEKGNVVSASVVSGHPLLRASAQAAAYRAKFSPTLLSGKPVRVTGIILYNFTPE